nr:immunoglobulin light chain junction region [Macaca mulatta]
CQNYSSPPHSF